MAGDIKILCTKAEMVPIAHLRPHPENDNHQSKFMFDKLLASIRSDGFADPIVVRTGNQKGSFGTYQVIGGEHRLKAAKKLGMTMVPVTNLGIVDDLVTRKLLVSLNKIRGDSNEDELAKIVKSIQADGGEDALKDLALDSDQLMTLLDGEVDRDADDDGDGAREGGDIDETTIVPKASARDLLVILSMSRMKGEELANLLGAARAWAASLEKQDEPAWISLKALLERCTPKKGRRR